MNIEIIKVDNKYQADCKDLPGMPPVGWGYTKVEALVALFYRMIFDGTGGNPPRGNWIPYIKPGPVTINGRLWRDPIKWK